MTGELLITALLPGELLKSELSMTYLISPTSFTKEKRFSATGTWAAGTRRNGKVTKYVNGEKICGCPDQPEMAATWETFSRLTQWFRVHQ